MNDNEAGFRICDGKGFHITFANGYTVSVQFGPGNYCDNYTMEIGRNGSKDAGAKGSRTAECAVWPCNGEMVHHFDGETVSNSGRSDGAAELGGGTNCLPLAGRGEAGMKVCVPKYRDEAAFPREEIQTDTMRIPLQWGLTKREYFSAMAMQGILAAGVNAPNEGENTAHWAAHNADFLLAELDKQSPPTPLEAAARKVVELNPHRSVPLTANSDPIRKAIAELKEALKS